MRLRHIPGCEAYVAASAYVAHEPETNRGQWNRFFGNDHPLELEIGMGKGQFIRTLSVRHPEINYIGLERFETVLMKAIQRTLLQDRGVPYADYRRALELFWFFELTEWVYVYRKYRKPPDALYDHYLAQLRQAPLLP